MVRRIEKDRAGRLDRDVQTIAVAPRSQGRGVGRQLLEALLDEARRRECAQIFLEVLDGNDSALALYDRAGFERVARRSSYYGPGLDALVLRRRLVDDADDAAMPTEAKA